MSAKIVSAQQEKPKVNSAQAIYSELQFPFDAPPKQHELVDIHPDIKWARSKLPISLDHINCYLLRDGDGWCLVDTGMNLPASKEAWENTIENSLNGDRITRVIATHQHPDHIGLCRWFTQKYEVPLLMSATEYYNARTWLSGGKPEPCWAQKRFFTTSNLKQASVDMMTGGSGVSQAWLPNSFQCLKDQQMLRVGEFEWRVITTSGHSPEHVSLHCAELDILISGDQVLPKITSNVSVSHAQPDSSPLRDWYESHDKLAEQVPDSVLILPAHEMPFKGLHYRLERVIEHHGERMDEIAVLCKEPLDAQTLTSKLFKRDLDPIQNYLAAGEALAHLHKMMEDGRIVRLEKDSIYLYQTL